jgi:NADPH2:quinone reductase
MRAMRVHQPGGLLRLETVAEPEPGPGEALIRVRAAAVNFADTLMVGGTYQETPPYPFSPGIEICGEVLALGPGCGPDVPAPGTRVAALCGAGGFAELAVAPAAACVAAPAAMPDAEAAGLQVAYGTSHLALERRARLRPGERLLVTGAGGGVGLTAVEIGALMGAEVIACARGEAKQALARSRGAAHVLEPEPATLRDAVRALGGADVVYDPVGGAVWEAALRAANPEGRLIPIGFASGEVPRIPANILLVKNLEVIGLYWGGYRRFRPEALADSLRTLLGWWEAGRIRPHVSRVLPLERAEQALDLLRRREAGGKVALTP